MKIPVVMAGVSGRTGREVGQAIRQADALDLIGAIAQQHAGEDLGTLWGDPNLKMVISPELPAGGNAVLVDFTEAQSAYGRIVGAMERGWDVVVGTTGFTAEQHHTLGYLAEKHGVGIAIIANFSLGAWVLEKISLEAAKYFSAVEIIESHTQTKRDKPSGTARQTAHVLSEALDTRVEAIPIHSVRLPGMVAHQTVIFGAAGQTMHLTHDVHDRSAYAAGVIATIQRIGNFRGQLITDLGLFLLKN